MILSRSYKNGKIDANSLVRDNREWLSGRVDAFCGAFFCWTFLHAENVRAGWQRNAIDRPTRQFAFGNSLAVEFSTEVLQAILVISLLAQTPIGSFAGRVGFVLIAGILAAITTNVSYWNWYGFPGVYTASYILIEIVSFVLVGVITALVLRRRSPAV